MSDYSVNGQVHHAKRVNKPEYFLYFTLIFSFAVLPHVLGWAFQTIRHGRLPRLGPVGRALNDAKAVTPMIFQG